MAFSAPTSPIPQAVEPVDQSRIWSRFSKWLGRDEGPGPSHEKDIQSKPSLGRRLSRRVVPGLPRPPTFRRQQSEKREKLLPVTQSGNERRVQSLDRRRARSVAPYSSTAHSLGQYPVSSPLQQPTSSQQDVPASHVSGMDLHIQPIRPMPPSTPPAESEHEFGHRVATVDHHAVPPEVLQQISQELEEKWILNLSMHFRDNSPREKFFVTYAETPTRWRRLTVSCDYRDAPPYSLERDLQALTYQRDKNARIYDAIRNSLPDIQFYDTVTNLRLQTDQDDRLHVHVTEDLNEIIPYPSTNAVKHLDYQCVNERDIVFDSHMSGFVYKVRVNNEAFEDKICVKKEIPGPDSVEEFLYEINALHALIGTSNVIQFEGLVVDEEHDLVKGLLISYANQGPMVDLIYDFKNSGALTWDRKEKWARQMIYGLSAIHEAGFVQGDCTLSNIVVDQFDDALIIDVNRRGCPVGWEPPEIHNMIESGHRISMYIGVKSDLFQLGMSLWALFTEEDEPERQQRPLLFGNQLEAPTDKRYLLDVARICLSEKPRDRLSAEKLLSFFPQERSPYDDIFNASAARHFSTNMLTTERDTVYVDPSTAMEEEVPREHFHHNREDSGSDHQVRRRSTISEEEERGRTPPRGMTFLPRPSTRTDETTLKDDLEPLIVSISPGREPRLEGGYFGVDTDDEDDEAMCRLLRRRHGVRSLESALQHVHEGENTGIMQKFEHIDSGLDQMMAVDTPNQVLPPFSQALDHRDSGLADMDVDYMDSNILARKRTDLRDIDEEVHHTASVDAFKQTINHDVDSIPAEHQAAVGRAKELEIDGSNTDVQESFHSKQMAQNITDESGLNTTGG